MPEETKSSPTPPAGGEKKNSAEKPVGSVQPVPPAGKTGAPAAQSASSGAAPAKPTAEAAASHTPPSKPTGPVPVAWDSPMVAKLQGQFGSGIIEASTYLGQNYFVVDRSLIPEMLQVLRDQEQFDYCVDVTAVHYPEREKPFDVIWILYSFPCNQRLRVKTQIADGELLPSSVPIWPTANWLEREVYDMFGIRFQGHPDMKRILLPEGWKGHPLRKDYGIIQQDKEWVQINLGIESGQ
jgi:NADH-quinone oxidoreductase subunit C